MGRFLNIGLIQPYLTEDAADVYEKIERAVDELMSLYHRPELIIGPECIQALVPEEIPGRQTNFFASLAKKHGIYFIPGSIMEVNKECPEGLFYNSAPIFNPKGELVDVYRKMAPWRPAESETYPGKRYVVFDIPEKNTKVGVQICYDINFPEISRNETLMGAEVLIKLTLDPEELYTLNKHVHMVRALENQAYVVSTQSVGNFMGSSLYGNSLVYDPEGNLLWEAGHNETKACVTIDLDKVSNARKYGTIFMDHYMQHLRDYAFPMPFADDIKSAPLFKDLPATPATTEEYESQMKEIGVGTIGKLNTDVDLDSDKFSKKMDDFLKSRGF